MTFDAKHDEPTPPLDKAPHDWLYVTLDGKRYKRETNTMPQWAGSCWYYLRFLDPKNDKALVDPQVEKAWMPVDLYVGGAEHAVLHLLYARFWHKVLFDRGYVSTPEPFQKLVNQGMILGENGEKMSKSRGNVVNPDEVVREYGADALRLYEMFMGPLEAVKPWSMDGVSGVRGFLDRAWRMIIDDRAEAVAAQPGRARRRAHGRAEPRAAQDDQGGHGRPRADVVQHGHRADDGVHQLLPRRSERAAAGGDGAVRAVALAVCPAHGRGAVAGAGPRRHAGLRALARRSTRRRSSEDTVEVPVQINGKLRGRIQVPADADKAALEAAARADAKIAELLAGKTVVKAIVVPGRMVNFVVK